MTAAPVGAAAATGTLVSAGATHSFPFLPPGGGEHHVRLLQPQHGPDAGHGLRAALPDRARLGGAGQ